MSGAEGTQFTIHHVNVPTSGRSGAIADPTVFMQPDGSVAATFVNGDRGSADVAVWRTFDTAQQRHSILEVYRLEPDLSPQRVAYTELSGSAGPTVNPTLLTGDIEASSAGSEIIVSGGDGPGRRTRVCVFGGMDGDGLHLLTDFYMPRRAMGDKPSAPMLGDVVPDTRHAGSELVIGGRRGRVYVVGLDQGRVTVLDVLRAFPDRPRASAQKLVVGDVIPDNPGDEIVVGDDGTVGDGLVRVFDSRTQRALVEFAAFPPGAAPAGVELWVGDVISNLPGAELIVGEGPSGGRLSVFTLASGVPTLVLDVPDPFDRSTTLRGHLAIGNLLPDFRGNEIAIAQADPRIPVQVFNLDADGNAPVATVQLSAGMDAVTSIAATH